MKDVGYPCFWREAILTTFAKIQNIYETRKKTNDYLTKNKGWG